MQSRASHVAHMRGAYAIKSEGRVCNEGARVQSRSARGIKSEGRVCNQGASQVAHVRKGHSPVDAFGCALLLRSRAKGLLNPKP